jgi:hypothetical protein
LAAIGVAGAECVIADVGDRRILARAAPRDGIDGGEQLLRDPVRVGLVADDGLRVGMQRRAETDVRPFFTSKAPVRVVRMGRRHFVRIDPEPPAVRGDFVADLERGRLSGHGPGFQIRRALQRRCRRQLRIAGVAESRRMWSCWPASSRGYGSHTRSVSPAGTASGFTVSV